MSSNVNKLRNPDFSRGGSRPQGWASRAGRGKAYVCDADDEAGRGLRIELDRAGDALWSQVVVCKPGEYYRIEATVSGSMCPSDDVGPYDPTGAVVQVEPVSRHDRPRVVGPRMVSPGVTHATKPVTIRAYYKAPGDVRRLRFSVGIINAGGTMTVHRAAVIPMLEPDELSHPLSIPPPAHTIPVARAVRRVCVCSATANDRRLTSQLREYFGPRRVRAIAPAALTDGDVDEDALLLPDESPPSSLRSLRRLFELAAGRTVVISLPGFVKLAGRTLSLRRVEQKDDPIHARVGYANFATRGFALHDAFLYAWRGRTPGSLVQRQFRKTGALRAFCRRHGFEVLLLSECDQDATTDRPICLYKPTSGGGLFVLDIEPVEEDGSTFGEPALAMTLLLNVLGRSQSRLGQYCSPAQPVPEVRGLIREMAIRFAEFVVHDDDVPTEDVTRQLVVIGRRDEDYGLPLKPKPVILVRSGLVSGDAESVFGALAWFKQLIRMEPHRCAYAGPLSSRYRLAWLPCEASWNVQYGFQRRGEQAPDAHLDDAMLAPLGLTDERASAGCALLVDVVSCPVQRARVVLPCEDNVYRRHAAWIPTLWSAFGAGPCFAPCVPRGEDLRNLDAVAWRFMDVTPDVVVEPELFRSTLHREVMQRGGRIVRIEVPGFDADATALSIARSDVGATLLEHVIGLEYGLIAVNRDRKNVRFDSAAPVPPGGALIANRDDPLVRAEATQAG